jgi:hypothetical protein
MRYKSSEAIAAKLIQDAIESEGCYIYDVDFKNSAVKIDGPDEVIASCVRAVAEALS